MKQRSKPNESSLLRLIGATVFMGLAVVMLLASPNAADWPLKTLSGASTLLMAASLVFMISLSEKGIWFVPASFAFVYCLFHFGLIICHAFELSLSVESMKYMRSWWFNDKTNYAIILVGTGLAAFVSGSAVGATLSSSAIRYEAGRIDERGRDLVGEVGLIMTAVSVGIWFLKVLKLGGGGLLLQSYAEFRSVTSEVFSSGYNYYFIGLGLIFLAVAKPSRLRRTGLAIFLVFAVAAMFLGLRSQVMFPAFAALTAAGLRRSPVSSKKMLVIGVCLLSLVSVVRQVREVGLEEVRLEKLSLVPWEGLAEMGGSLRPVVEVVGWTRRGDDYIFAASYWAPFSRALARFIPAIDRPPPAEDHRLLGEVIGRRVGSIGFSIIAEAYVNFGRFGVFFIMLGLGIALAVLGQKPATIWNQLKVGVVVLPLMMHIRNSFIMVPASIIVGLLTISLVRRWSGFWTASSNNYRAMRNDERLCDP